MFLVVITWGGNGDVPLESGVEARDAAKMSCNTQDSPPQQRNYVAQTDESAKAENFWINP
jgi:hypothetical protein